MMSQTESNFLEKTVNCCSANFNRHFDPFDTLTLNTFVFSKTSRNTTLQAKTTACFVPHTSEEYGIVLKYFNLFFSFCVFISLTFVTKYYVKIPD